MSVEKVATLSSPADKVSYLIMLFFDKLSYIIKAAKSDKENYVQSLDEGTINKV